MAAFAGTASLCPGLGFGLGFSPGSSVPNACMNCMNCMRNTHTGRGGEEGRREGWIERKSARARAREREREREREKRETERNAYVNAHHAKNKVNALGQVCIAPPKPPQSRVTRKHANMCTCGGAASVPAGMLKLKQKVGPPAHHCNRGLVFRGWGSPPAHHGNQNAAQTKP